MANRPSAEVHIDEALARRLLLSQAPELGDLEIRSLSRGWDNTNLRLGDELIIRMPHRREAVPLIAHEQRWLPELAPSITLPIPAPVLAGVADESMGYRWPWSIVPWFAGTEAADAKLTQPERTAERLGDFFASLHVPGPDDAPTNPYRGKPLNELRPAVEQRLGLLGERWDRNALRDIFETAASAPESNDPVWLHGDLHLRNMVVDNGELSAIIDWGDICTGDRATDLAGAFMLTPDDLEAVRRRAGADDAAWARARGWAIHFGAMYCVMSDDEPIQRSIGEKLLEVMLDVVN